VPEAWKITAAKRFNDKIRITPTDLYWPQEAPEPEPPTVAEMIIETNVKLLHTWAGIVGLGRVA
jgi:hypothetical protein